MTKELEKLIINSIDDLIFVLDSDFFIVNLYTQSIEKLCINSSDSIGKNIFEFDFLETDCANINLELVKARETKKVSSVEYTITQGDKTLYFDMRINPVIEDEKLIYFICVSRDITDRKEIELKLKELSIKDPLTNIYNRRYIFELLKNLHSNYSSNKELFSVAIIDIDNFKNINDAYGHTTGDYILQEFSKFISSKIRHFDFIGRFGGEEFIVLMPTCDKFNALQRINNILAKLRLETFYYKEHSVKFTFSCGISDNSDLSLLESSIDKLIDIADTRLYIAKGNGRNQVII